VNAALDVADSGIARHRDTNEVLSVLDDLAEVGSKRMAREVKFARGGVGEERGDVRVAPLFERSQVRQKLRLREKLLNLARTIEDDLPPIDGGNLMVKLAFCRPDQLSP
jgi:hypothetical protein